MDTIMTPEGQVCIWDTQKDFTELCRRYISDDAANYIDAVIADIDSENEYQRSVFQSDFRALEQEVEGYRNELWDLKEQLEHISYEADEKPGLSKKKILENIDGIWMYLQQIL